MSSVPLVLACGLTTLDVRQTVEHVPAADEKVVARDLAVEVGGPAANAATTCTALGVAARLLTRVGGATVGRIATEDLARHGVELVDLAGPDDAPAVSTVLVTAGTGQRAVASVNATLAPAGGAAPRGLPSDAAADHPEDPRSVADRSVADSALDGATAVLVDGHHLDLAVPVARQARARGVVVVLDGGSWKPGLERLLAHVDVAVLSADFRLPAEAAQHGAADLLDAVRALGPAVVAQSHGSDPVEVRTDQGRERLAVPRVTVVDTLGAGDVLHGAIVAWLARAHRPVDDTAPVLPALRFAVEVASASCAAPGARGWTADGDALALLRAALPA